LGPSASGKTFSQRILAQQLLPEALEDPVSIHQVDEVEKGLRMANPVFFVSIDGEIVREVEESAKVAKKAKSGFKKNIRIALQSLGFNTVEPTVHSGLLKESIKRMEKAKMEFRKSKKIVYPPSVFKVICVYASLEHTEKAAAQRAQKIGKSPSKSPWLSWKRVSSGAMKEILNLRLTKASSEYFDINSEFVIIDNQFG